MSDYTCRCSPSNSTLRATAEAARSAVTGCANRVTETEADIVDLDNRVTTLEGINESAFIVVDTEAELTAALLTGKHILIRGEGNGGRITSTSPKEINIPGTRIWGYGYNHSSGDHFSELFLNHGNFAYGTYQNGFNVNASDVEIAGLNVRGSDLSLSYGSYFAFYLSTAENLNNLHFRDLTISNVNRAIGNQGIGHGTTRRNLVIERCYIHTTMGDSIGLEGGFAETKILNNRIVPKVSGYSLTFTTRGISMASDINDTLIEGNRIENTNRIGIELTSTLISGTTFYDMYRNKTVNNTVLNSGSMGISYGFANDGVISGNVVDTVIGQGIENSAGATYGQSTRPHNAVISGNIVRNVTSTGECYGITADKTVGDLIYGNRIDTITGIDAGATGEKARGIYAYQAKQTFIHGNHLTNIDGTGIRLQAISVADALGQHVVQNNVFRALSTTTNARYAVYVYDTVAVVRNNIAWEPAGGAPVQAFYANLNAPVVVYPGFDWSGVVSGGTNFLESNLRVTY